MQALDQVHLIVQVLTIIYRFMFLLEELTEEQNKLVKEFRGHRYITLIIHMLRRVMYGYDHDLK